MDEGRVRVQPVGDFFSRATLFRMGRSMRTLQEAFTTHFLVLDIYFGDVQPEVVRSTVYLPVYLLCAWDLLRGCMV